MIHSERILINIIFNNQICVIFLCLFSSSLSVLGPLHQYCSPSACLVVTHTIFLAVIYINFEHKEIIDNANEPLVKKLFVFFYVISILFLLLAFCGLYGSIKARGKKNKLSSCMLSIYLISVIVFFLAFLAMTITMFAAPPAIFGASCK